MREVEEAAALEAKMVEQRRRELEEERENEKLRRLQGKSSSSEGYVFWVANMRLNLCNGQSTNDIGAN